MKTAHILAFANLGSVALAAVPLWGQCGGNNYSGDTDCVSGACCTEYNPWYSQCVACSDSNDDESPTTEEPVSETQFPDDEDEDEDEEDGDDVEDCDDSEEECEATEIVTSTVFGGDDNWQTSVITVPTSVPDDEDDDQEEPEPETTAVATATSGPGNGSGDDSGNGGSAPSAVTRTLPASSGSVSSSTAIPVSGTFDGGMKLYDRSRKSLSPRSSHSH